MPSRKTSILTRLIFRFGRSPLRPLEAVSPRTYMRFINAMLRRCGVRLRGTPRFISSSVRFDQFHLLEIGDRVAMSRNVALLTHDYSLTTTLRAIGEAPPTDIAINRDIRIGANVFIGMNAILLPGTTIEDNVIIAAGSVVRGHLAGDAIYAGNPARRVSGITDRASEWRARRDGSFAAADAV